MKLVITIKFENKECVHDEIYYCNIEVLNIRRNKFGKQSNRTFLLKEQLFCMLRYEESTEYYENEIKRKLRLKLEEVIQIKKVIILKSLGYANKIKEKD
jgi:hypothetical protein